MSKAKSGSSNRSSAYGTPSSLTSLLSPTQYPLPQISLPPLYQGWTHEPLSRLVDLDRRQFHPQQEQRPPAATVRRAARLFISPVRTVGRELRREARNKALRAPVKALSSTVRFAIPSHVGICVRRKVRREVLHALKRTNKRGTGGPRRRNPYSGIKC